MFARETDGSEKFDELVETVDRLKAQRFVYNIYGLIISIFGKAAATIELVENVSQNQLLFYLYARSDSKKFLSLKRAIACATDTKGVLIHFSELGVYGVYTVSEYATLLGNIRAKVEEENKVVNFHPQEVVLTGLPQKLVFICHGSAAVVERIRAYVLEKYNCAITCVCTEDTTEIALQTRGGNNYAEAQQVYSELLEYIRNVKNDRATAQKISPLPVETKKGSEFIIANVSGDSTQILGAADVIAALKSVQGGVVVNLVINYGNYVNAGRDINGGVVNQAVDPKAEALAWIRVNPPADKEPTSAYYERYQAAFGDRALHRNQFGGLTKLEGYEKGKNDGVRFYKM